MGWFEDQIKQRMRMDDEAFSEAFAGMAGAVMGRGILAGMQNERQRTLDAVGEILSYYHVKPVELPKEITDLNEQLEYLLRPSGVMRRMVFLEGKWYNDALGAYLGTLKSGEVVALLPFGAGYAYIDHTSGKRVKVNSHTAKLLDKEAVCFYKPLPLHKLGVKDLIGYIIETLSVTDLLAVGAATAAVTAVGMLLPKLTNILFRNVIDTGSLRLFAAIGTAFLCITVSGFLIGLVKSTLTERMQTKTGVAVQAASMMRVLSLPAKFFRGYSSGELASRVQSINLLCEMLVDTVFTSGLTALFSLIYIAQIFNYAPALVVPSLAVTLITLVFSIVSALVQMEHATREMGLSAKESGLVYSFLTGVQKLKLAGAEKRAFSKWAEVFGAKAKLLYDPPAVIKYNTVLGTAITLLGTVALYYFAVESKVSVADYFAFNTAYGMVSGAFMELSAIALTAANIKPVLAMVKPLLEATPEVAAHKLVLTKITGNIELNNVSFRYSDNMPLILDNLTLRIKPGQYVALVGRTGCGKSTLTRLILGFETPQKGAVYFDGKDLADIDLRSLRRRIGVVMQNGKLFSGDIFSNITIAAPALTLDDAWAAAEAAGIADDIRAMPMGMHTLITEGAGGLSGGQRQRIMIARAIAPKPRVLIFDEATSALDNITQKAVSESLAGLKCTRIVIAHRLSTVRECDRILYLEGGRILEDGTYDELMARNGKFTALVARQQLETDASKAPEEKA